MELGELSYTYEQRLVLHAKNVRSKIALSLSIFYHVENLIFEILFLQNIIYKS